MMILAHLFLIFQFAVMYWWIIGATSGPLRLLVRQVKSVKNPNHSMTSCLARDVVLSNISITNCGRCVNVTSSGGVIQSPNYPDNYGQDFSCLYLIGVPSGKRIQLTFPTFIIRTEVDLLTVNDGPEPNAPQAVNMNGYRFRPSLTSVTNQLTIQFTSDRSATSNVPSGTVPSFQAVYSVVD